MDVEKFIKESERDFKVEELFEELSDKIDRKSFEMMIKKLLDNNRILIDGEGNIIYTWNPKLIKILKNRMVF